MLSVVDDGSRALDVDDVAASPLRRKDIFWAVFGALWAFGITYAIVAVIYFETIK